MKREVHQDLYNGFLLALSYQCILICCVLIAIFFVRHSLTPTVLKEIFNAWDGNSYVSLAQHGYVSVGEEANYIAFYPFYPLLISIVSFIGIPVHLAGVLITIISSLIGHTALYLFLRERGMTSSTVRRVLLLFFLTPVSVYFTLVCTEGVFLSCVALFFLFLYRRSFALAAICGFLASTTRLVGITLFIPFALYFWENRSHSLPVKKLLWGALIPMGFCVYLGINYYLYQNPFHYQSVLESVWNKRIVNPLVQYYFAITRIPNLYPATYPTVSIDTLTTLISPIILGLYCFFKRKNLWIAGIGFTAANLLIITAQSYWLSNTRYIALIFPLYIFIEELTQKSRLLYALICLLFFILSLYGITIFARGGWLY